MLSTRFDRRCSTARTTSRQHPKWYTLIASHGARSSVTLVKAIDLHACKSGKIISGCSAAARNARALHTPSQLGQLSAVKLICRRKRCPSPSMHHSFMKATFDSSNYKTYDASCHCGAIRLSADVSPPLDDQEVVACNCQYHLPLP